MASNNVSLGELIHQVGERNKGLLSTEPLGVSIDKEFMPSVANTIGTDLSKYMLLRRNRFACNPMHVGRDRALPIARYKNDAPGIVSPAYMTFEADESKIDLDYLELFFKLAVFDKECWFYTDSTVRGGLSWDALCSIELNLPSFDDQRKIASIVKVIRERMVRLAEQNDYLTELGKMIWAQTANQAAKTVKIAEAAADVVTGKTPSTKKPENYGEEYPFITIPDMHSAVWLCSTERCLSEAGNSSQPKKLVQRGSVLVSCIATVGLVGIVQKPSHFNQQINAVIPANEGDEFYLYYALHSIKQELLGIGATGSATLNVNKGAFSNIEIPWPESSAMDSYVRTVEPLFKAIEANTLESLRLQELRDTLLPKLMSGEIDVSKVEI